MKLRYEVSFAILDFYIYERKERHRVSQNHHSSDLAQRKRKGDILKSATDIKRMTWEWCACIRKKCHALK